MLMRPKESIEVAVPEKQTFTGNRGLDIEEGLIFETGRPENTGVDLDEPAPFAHRLGSLERQEPAGLPGLSEPETMRHYVRLSRMNYAIDAGIYPLGSCTMKHNPRLNEAMARLPGFADIHPLQPQSTVQGALELIAELARWLMVLTGMDAVAMSPRAGAHGEACGMMVIKAAIAAKGEGETRKIVLVPEFSAWHQPSLRRRRRVRCASGSRTPGRHARSGGRQGETWAGRRRDHADKPQHLRAVREGYRRNRLFGA